MTKPRPILLAATATILALAGAMAVYLAPHAPRSASAGPTVNLMAAAKRCAALDVALHGTKAPTITCLRRSRPPSPVALAGHAFLTTGTVSCQDPSANLVVVLNSGIPICFSGTGYVGLNPSIIGVVGLSAIYDSWVRLYDNGAGTYFNLKSGGVNEYFWGAQGNGGPAGNVGITQVDDGNGHHG